MSAIEKDGPKVVRCNCSGLTGDARYEVSGRFLVLHSRFGSVKTILGLQKPARLARRLLQNICEKEAATLLAARNDRPSEIKRSVATETLAGQPSRHDRAKQI